ncbi:phenylalanine--tRNA ligase subunit beta [Sutterella wadsworthensis]|uniref:phenylalanine--tRNA ligase subunit beta n=1 Tax=Sutterella wadsworthensis TaxID=40545 RepID=UPI003A9438EA
MNISRKWLREFVDITATDKEYDSVMTLAGQKVETTERMDAEIKNVVVGKVLSMKKHENSDHMWVCMVDCSIGEPVQIVTGAQNVHEGDLVPVAQHNSYLPGGIHITKGKLRGVESCGMLCSYKELGLTEHDCPEAYADGIWILNNEGCKVGEDMNVVIGNDDSIVEFEITNNRPDCYSLIGLARETAAAFNVPMKHHEPVVKGGAEGNLCNLLDVDVQADDLCPRYTARMVRNVKIAPSPKWMRQRLRSAGIRPINNIVDITNYVMVEYGQPMHAFDYRYVKGGKIVVRRAGADKTLTTLDGSVRVLQPDMLVIADETKPVGLAGVMGGENSEIVADTVDVVFESANFLGSSIRKTALALGMRTDASAKFEKDIDPMLTVPAVNRACELVELLGAGEVMDGMIDVLHYVPQPVTVKLEPERINALLGTNISEADMIEYLHREEVPVVDGMIQVPSWRPDLRVMADIAEEVARYYGYNNIETTLMRGATTMGGYSDEQKLENAAGAAARALGYSEIITYSFVSPSSFDAIRIPADSPLRKTVKLVNPLGEDTSIMRTVILPSMLDILSRNFAFKNKGVKLYEIGKIYLPVEGEKLPNEPKRMIFGTYGEHENFFTLKGEVDALLEQLNVHPATYVADTKNPSYHPGRCADIMIDGKKLGVIGQIHPLVAEGYGISGEVYVAELDFTGLQSALAPERVFHSLPKFPTVSRDLALVCDEAMTVGMLEACIKKAGGKLLRSIQLFDIYRGPGIAPGKKSVAFSLELRADDRTLTDEDTTGVTNAVLEKLKNDLGVTLR